MKYRSLSGRHGGAVLFLCIILSALILSQSILYLGAVSRASEAEMRRCLQLQADQYLCKYNDLLYEYFGIYGIGNQNHSQTVFDECMRFHTDVTFESKPYSELSADDLNAAVTDFMKIRMPAIAGYELIDRLKGVIESINGSTLVTQASTGVTNDWTKYLKEYVANTDHWSAILANAENFIDVIGFSEKLGDLKDFIQDLRFLVEKEGTQYLQNDEEGLLNIDIFSPDALSKLTEFVSCISESDSGVFIERLYLNQYVMSLFDSSLETCSIDGNKINESNIFGVSYKEIHGTNQSDIEYLLTGVSEGKASVYITRTLIFSVRSVLNLGSFLFDNEKLNTAEGIADILSICIAAISAGSVVVEPQVIKYIVIFVWALVEACKDVNKLINGESICLISHSNIEDDKTVNALLTTDYRDYIGPFMLLVSKNDLLDRMIKIFKRDFGGTIYTGVYISAQSRGVEYSLRDRYDVYM